MLRREGPIGTVVARTASPIEMQTRSKATWWPRFRAGCRLRPRSGPAPRVQKRAVALTSTKGNATIRIGLRFRYHPAPEAGSPTLTPRASLEGVAVDGGQLQAVRFVLFRRIGGIAEP